VPTKASGSFIGTLVRGMLVLAGVASVGVAGVDAARRFGGIDNVLGKPEKLHLV